MITIRSKYLIFAAILFLTEVCIALFINDSFIRPHFGDFLVVILIYCFIRGICNVGVSKTALFVLLFSYLVEFFQYLHLVQLLGLEKNKIAKVIIGNSFSWIDILLYTMGVLFVLFLERKKLKIRD